MRLFIGTVLALAACGGGMGSGPDGGGDDDDDVVEDDGGGVADAAPSLDAYVPDCTSLGTGWVRLGGDLQSVPGLGPQQNLISLDLTARFRPTVTWVSSQTGSAQGYANVCEAAADGSWSSVGSALSPDATALQYGSVARHGSRIAATPVAFHFGSSNGFDQFVVIWDGLGWTTVGGHQINTALVAPGNPAVVQHEDEVFATLRTYYAATSTGPTDLHVIHVDAAGVTTLEHPRAAAWGATENLFVRGLHTDRQGRLVLLVDGAAPRAMVRDAASGTWSEHPAGPPPFTLGQSGQGSDGTIVVASAEGPVYELDDSAWTTMVPSVPAGTRRVVVDGMGRLVSLVGSNGSITGWRWNGALWQQIGGSMVDGVSFDAGDLAVDDCGRPVAALATRVSTDQPYRVHAYRYDSAD
jgi:hypothetical protein